MGAQAFYRSTRVLTFLSLFKAGNSLSNLCNLRLGSEFSLNPFVQFVQSRQISIERVGGLEYLSYPYNNDATLLSQRYRALINLEGQLKTVTITIPALSGNTEHEVAFKATSLLEALPVKFLSTLNEIRFHPKENMQDGYWRKKYKNFSSSGMTADGPNGVINVFPAEHKGLESVSWSFSKANLRHELGHILAYKMWGTYEPPSDYKEAAWKDKHGISHYGSNSWSEDFAECVRYYLYSDGGKKWLELRKKFKFRFDYLDNIFEVNAEQLKELQRDINKRKVKLALVKVTASGLVAYWLYENTIIEEPIDQEGDSKQKKNIPGASINQ